MVNLALYSILMANGMTTDVYQHRDNCIAPDIALIVWTTNTKSARARARVALGRDGRMIDLRLPSGSPASLPSLSPLPCPPSPRLSVWHSFFLLYSTVSRNYSDFVETAGHHKRTHTVPKDARPTQVKS